MSLEEDPKEVARKERKTPQCDQLMKQFCKMESSVDPVKYKAGHDLTFSNKCLDCDGFGTVPYTPILGSSRNPDKYTRTDQPCPSCDGTGKKHA